MGLSELISRMQYMDPALQEINKEADFQKWIKSLPWYKEFGMKYGEYPNLDDPQYNYRGAYNAGISPQRYQYDAGMYHWPSLFKSEDHPTMWMERFMQKFGYDPNEKGITKEMAQKMMYGGQ